MKTLDFIGIIFIINATIGVYFNSPWWSILIVIGILIMDWGEKNGK